MPFINSSEATKRSKDRKINGKCTNSTNRRSRVWPVYFRRTGCWTKTHSNLFPQCIQLSVRCPLNSCQTLLFSPVGLTEKCIENSCFRRFFSEFLPYTKQGFGICLSNKKRGKINHPLGGCSITAYDWLSIEQ